jgi:hypothetical protein
MLQALLFILLAYILYRFVFNFLIPVFVTARQFKRQVREFQSRMQPERDEFKSSSSTFSSSSSSSSKRDKGDYIEFEEVK